MTFKIEYEIRLNDDGRPYIHLPDHFQDIPEHRFFVLEMSRYILFDVVDKNSLKSDNERISNQALEILQNTAISLSNISDEMAMIIKSSMLNKISITKVFNDIKFDVSVYKKSELKNILKGFLFNNRIHIRKNNLKVLVIDELIVYRLDWSNVDNPKWIPLNTIEKDEESPKNEA
jgi:hypothetical protein